MEKFNDRTALCIISTTLSTMLSHADSVYKEIEKAVDMEEKVYYAGIHSSIIKTVDFLLEEYDEKYDIYQVIEDNPKNLDGIVISRARSFTTRMLRKFENGCDCCNNNSCEN